MEHTAPGTVTSERIPAVRLLRIGALAAAMSASVNALVLAIASSLFGPVVIPPDEAVTIGQVMGASAAGAIGAAVVFGAVGRFAPIALAGATGSSAGTLAFMHVVAAATDVGLLTRLGRKEKGLLRRSGMWRGSW
jgi:hypothetical protein